MEGQRTISPSLSVSLASPNLLKTCRTCFHAKIRCDRSHPSGSCDRCLRLGKECVFSPARRRVVPGSRTRERLGTNTIGRMPSTTPSPGADDALNQMPLPSSISVDYETSLDPVATGLLSSEKSETLLDVYIAKMMAQSPFVVLPATATASMLRRDRPVLCLAILAAASANDAVTQKALGRMLNRAVVGALAEGQFSSLELLQGLLVCLAWAHYQPRPRRFSQYLHLATSIVADLRLDRPRNPSLWNVEKVSTVMGSEDEDEENKKWWGPDEMRALIGTYYLTSASSVFLQKMRHFPYSDFIQASSRRLAAAALHPTDAYLPHIVRLQLLAEEVDDMVHSSTSAVSLDEVRRRTTDVHKRLDDFKSSLRFPLSNCPPLVLQIHAIELLVGQLLLPGLPFSMHISQSCSPPLSDPTLVQSLTDGISAAKALIHTLLIMTPSGDEFAMTNLGWILLSFGTSLAVRLDVVARDPKLWPAMQHLVRFLDIRHNLQQVVLRLEAMVGQQEDGTFVQLLRRAWTIEAWYLRQLGTTENTTKNMTVQVTQSAENTGGLDTVVGPHLLDSTLVADFSGIENLMESSMTNFLGYEGQLFDTVGTPAS